MKFSEFKQRLLEAVANEQDIIVTHDDDCTATKAGKCDCDPLVDGLRLKDPGGTDETL